LHISNPGKEQNSNFVKWKKKVDQRFQDGGYREEAENMPPKVKSWRDAGNTPCRKNH
jgi:hypothetical protein